jgi:DNA-binding HxlR family transcriptional regulator
MTDTPKNHLPTVAQLRILRLLEDRRPPTFREIMARCGYASTKAVADHLTLLEKKGLVEQPWGKGTSRGWTLTDAGRQTAAIGREVKRKKKTTTISQGG